MRKFRFFPALAMRREARTGSSTSSSSPAAEFLSSSSILSLIVTLAALRAPRSLYFSAEIAELRVCLVWLLRSEDLVL